MTCTNCGSETREQRTFCHNCGEKLFVGPVGKAEKDGSFNFSPYGTTVRQQVFEVIVRQAIAGAPWREMCALPMQINNITEKEIKEEVECRTRLMNSQFKSKDEERPEKTAAEKVPVEKDEGDEHSAGKSASAPPRPTSIADWRLYAKKDSVSLKLDSISKKLKKLLQETLQHTEKEKIVDALLADLEESLEEIVKLESILESIQREMDSRRSFDREQERTCKPFFPDQTPPGSDKPDDPHRIDW